MRHQFNYGARIAIVDPNRSHRIVLINRANGWKGRADGMVGRDRWDGMADREGRMGRVDGMAGTGRTDGMGEWEGRMGRVAGMAGTGRTAGMGEWDGREGRGEKFFAPTVRLPFIARRHLVSPVPESHLRRPYPGFGITWLRHTCR